MRYWVMPNRELPSVTAATKLQTGKIATTKINSKRSGGGLPENKPPRSIDACQFLFSLPEFSLLPVDALKELAAVCRFATIDSGKYISLEGEEESLNGFVVVSGCFAMLKSSIKGKELIVELLQSGDIFGLLLMLAGGRKPVQLSARALQKSEVLWVPVANFNYLLASYPFLFKKFVAHILRSFTRHITFPLGLPTIASIFALLLFWLV